MHTSLKKFMRQFTAVVLVSLVPVALVAFLSIPFTLGHHPGEFREPAVVTLHLEA